MMHPEPTPETVTKLCTLTAEHRRETNPAERAKRRNRLICAYRIAIRQTRTVAGLNELKELADPIQATLPHRLLNHLKRKIANYAAIEAKAATAAARRKRQVERRRERQANMVALPSSP